MNQDQGDQPCIHKGLPKKKSHKLRVAFMQSRHHAALILRLTRICRPAATPALAARAKWPSGAVQQRCAANLGLKPTTFRWVSLFLRKLHMTCKAFIPNNQHCLFNGQDQHPHYGCKHATGRLCPVSGVKEVNDAVKFEQLVAELVRRLQQQNQYAPTWGRTFIFPLLKNQIHLRHYYFVLAPSQAVQ